MARNIIGARADELREVQQTMRAMLKEGGEAPTGRFEDLKFLEPVREYKARHLDAIDL